MIRLRLAADAGMVKFEYGG